MASRAMSPPPVYDSATPTSLRPYLELPYLLSLAWIAYPIISLVFVIFRIQTSADSAQGSVANAKENFLASCKAAEGAASSTASFPRYMAIAANHQFTDAVNGTLSGARDALVLSLTVMEAIINFLVDIYRSTFLCFLELIIRGTLSVIISAVQEISSVVQSSLNFIASSIQNDVNSVNSAIQSLVDGVNKVIPFSKINAPQFTVPSLTSLQNVTIPSDFTQALINLNNSIPSPAQIKDKLNALLDTPFELTKQEITDAFNNITFNQAVFPIPQQSTITFCDQVDTSVIDDLGHDIIKITKIATIILIVVIILLILANCALEWYKWRCLQNHLEYTRQAWNTDPAVYHHSTMIGSPPTIQLTNHNLLTLHGITAHPLLMRIANQITALLRFSPSKQIHLKWFFSFVFHPPALACFLIGFVGLLSVQLQLIALGPIEESYRNKALSSATNFTDTIATAMNNNMLNQSAVFVSQVNSEVGGIQNTINDGVFGWVNSTTSTLNTTLNDFYADVQDLVETIFGGTPLDQPMHDFVSCIIGSKVDALTDALTFMHDNLHVNMPQMNQSALLLSPQDVNDAARPIALAAIGSGNGQGDDGGIVGRIVSAYVTSLEKERIMFLIFIGIWGVVVIMALLIIFWHSYIKPFTDRRERRKWQKEQREGFDQFQVRGAHINESSMENGGRSGMDLPPFTSLPSSRPGFLETLTSPRRRIGSPQSLNGFFESDDEKRAHLDAKRTVRFKTTSRGFPGTGLFGRKTMDKEKFVIDLDEEPVSTGNSARPSLFSRLAALNPFGKKKQDLQSPTGLSSSRPGPRSNHLSINTDRAAVLEHKDLPMIESPSPTNGPKSAWSASPTELRFPGDTDGRDSIRRFQATPPRLSQVDAERRTKIVNSGPLSLGISAQGPPSSPQPSEYYVSEKSPLTPGHPLHPNFPRTSAGFSVNNTTVNPFATPFDDSRAEKQQQSWRKPIPSPTSVNSPPNTPGVWNTTNGTSTPKAI